MASLLPPTKWGAALDFLLYEDIRSTLLVSRIFRREVAGRIETLSVRLPKELDIPSARRFPNVTTVKILFFGVKKVDGMSFLMEAESLPIDTVTKIIPFLQTFPQLSRAKVFISDDPILAWFPLEITRYREFLLYLAGTFESRALQLDHIDILDPAGGVCEKWTDDALGQRSDCNICQQICRSFPFQNVLDLHFGCVDIWDRIDIIAKRPSGCRFLRHHKHLYFILSKLVDVIVYNETGPSTVAYRRYFIRPDDLNKLQEHINRFGCDPNQVEWHGLARRVFKLQYNAARPAKLERMTLEKLSSLGFDINTEDFFGIVDECVEPEAYDSSSSEDWDLDSSSSEE